MTIMVLEQGGARGGAPEAQWGGWFLTMSVESPIMCHL